VPPQALWFGMPLKKITTPSVDPQKLARDLGKLEQTQQGPSRKGVETADPKLAPSFTGEESTRGPSRSEQKTVGTVGNVGGGAAKMGFATLLSDKKAGPKAAIAGLGFFDNAARNIKKGVLTALAGITLFSAVVANNAPLPSVTRAPQERSSSIDMRSFALTGVQTQKQHGQRALSDAKTLVAQWETQKASDPSFVVTGDKAKELIAAALLPFKAGVSDDLGKVGKEKLGGDTKNFIASMLDANAFKLDDAAKALLETVTDRVMVSADGKLKITGDQSGEKLHLEGVPGATVEGVNLSTIPTKRLTANETFVLGQVGADGKLSADMPMRAGDQVRVRLKLADGTTTDWVQIRAQGLGADTRNAEVALFRVGLSDGGNGKINVTNINASRTISEPGAMLKFVNTRTNESATLTINKDGSFDAGSTLPGAAGDSFSVRVSDGVNDTAFATEIGKVKVGTGRGGSQVHDFDLPDPGLHADELDEAGKPKFNMERFRGPLFDIDGAKATDVQQGQIGDCYLPAAVAAIAHHMPGHFENMIKQKIEVDPNTGVEKVWFEVTFQERTWENGEYKFKPIVQSVDADLFVRSWGGPLYGADDGARSLEDMELWWPILEKAYADWKGDYNTIGNGGHVSTVFRDMLGTDADSMSISGWSSSTPEEIWSKIVETVDAKRPIGAGTHGHDQDAIYANTGVYANHAYSILGYETAADGTKFVQVRNPWGESEPFPGDGKNDGIFKLKLDDFMKLYSSLYYVDK
jgi:hypothetical protein